MRSFNKPMIKWIFGLFVLFTVYDTNGQNPGDYTFKLTTSYSNDPPAISFEWDSVPGDSEILIYRKLKGILAWGDPIVKLPATSISYSDLDVQIGIEYEYQLIKSGGLRPVITYVSSGIQCNIREYRGKVILLIDSTFINDLQPELTQFKNDLTGDGWEILCAYVSRDASVKSVKRIIGDMYNSDPVNTKSLFLIGHIPVPYSGCDAYDGHIPEHYGAWPADLYYGDSKEAIWTDGNANCTDTERDENRNELGDGKFDVVTLPINHTISLQIGRVDFYNLPIFSESESELLKNYLIKDHNFRHKINDPRREALITDGFGWFGGEAISLSGWRNLTALLNSSHVKQGKYFPDMKFNSYIWSFGCGGGQFDYANSVGYSSDFATQRPRTVFTSLFGSWFGDWDSQNNLMRSALASKSWILTCAWEGRPYHVYHPMGMGETIGYCIKATQNNSSYDAQYCNRCVHVSLMGDPTLRMHVVCPPNSLESAITANNKIMLSWKPADDNILGYYIYKLDTSINRYERISPVPVTDTYYEDSSVIWGNNIYMIKTLKLESAASGSYYNLSQGIFDTLNYHEQTAIPVSEIELNLNSENPQPLVIYDAFKVDARILPENATNKLLVWSVENMTAAGRLDKAGMVYPEKAGTLAVIAEALDGSGIKGRIEIAIDSIPGKAGNISGSDSVCRMERKTYTIAPIRGATSYIWTLPNGVKDTTLVNEKLLNFNDKLQTGTLKVKGQNSFGVGIESEFKITVNEIPPTPVISFMDSVLISNIGEGNQWYLNGLIIPNAMDYMYMPDNAGSYSTKVTVNGCISSMSNQIKIFANAVEETLNPNEITIFPNPASGTLVISYGSGIFSPVNIEIYDLLGRKILSETHINTQNTNLDISGIMPGNYILVLYMDSKIVRRSILIN